MACEKRGVLVTVNIAMIRKRFSWLTMLSVLFADFECPIPISVEDGPIKSRNADIAGGSTTRSALQELIPHLLAM
jgi:hypothetical protein